ncbi:MAG: cytochrome c [Candidatus Kuenenia sp.]|nr:cytochrome c [Candidatus Kuenenia hertensis]
MKRPFILGVGLSCFFGLTGILGLVYQSHLVAGEGQIVTHEQSTGKHAELNLPIRTFTRELEQSVNKVLNGILEGNFDSVEQEADNIATKSKSIYVSFFENSNRFRKLQENPARDEQKRDFAMYVDEINNQVAALKKASESQNSEQALNAMVGLLKNGCVSCHIKYRK